jgi:hypothetical protein
MTLYSLAVVSGRRCAVGDSRDVFGGPGLLVSGLSAGVVEFCLVGGLVQV